MKRFRGRLVFKAHRLLYHSTLDVRVIKNKDDGTHVRWSASSSAVETSNIADSVV